MPRSPVEWLAARDPGLASTRRAVRVAVVAPSAFAIGSQVLHSPVAAVFATFGSFALLLFVDFGGGRRARLYDYAMLVAVGAVLIVLGSCAGVSLWLAGVGMAVVGFGVLFAGVVSSVIAAASRGALLTFVLPVMYPGGPATIPDRLLGWALAAALAVPAALFVFPPPDRLPLRHAAAVACRAVGGVLEVDPAVHRRGTGDGDPVAALADATAALRRTLRATAARPVPLSTAQRLLVRLADELEWLGTTAVDACRDSTERWRPEGRRLRAAAAATVEGLADALSGPPTPAMVAALREQRAHLLERREAVAAETLQALRRRAEVAAVLTGPGAAAGPGPDADAAGPDGGVEVDDRRPLYVAHELGYTVTRCLDTVLAMLAADLRPWTAKLVGRAPAAGAEGEITAARHLAASGLTWRSVWLRTSIRGAIGLAGAVTVARATGEQNGFWVVLGAMSVLRTNAVSTGATALRALLGTAVGFAIGALVLWLIGTHLTVLWLVLPVAVLFAAVIPDVVSFAAGQAAFTVTVIVLFNIVRPTGWPVGVVRVEDVATGAAVAVVAGLLFWPRGAATALGRAIGEAWATAATALEDAVDRFTAPDADADGAEDDAGPVRAWLRRAPSALSPTPRLPGPAADAAARRLDDAFRSYLAERGGKQVSLADVVALVTTASRLRLAGEALATLGRTDLPPVEVLRPPAERLRRGADEVSGWYARAADVVAGRAADLAPDPSAGVADAGREAFLDVLLPAVDGCRDDVAARGAERLLWAGQYVGDVDRLRPGLREPVARVAALHRVPVWRR